MSITETQSSGILWDPDGILAPQWTRTNIERGVGAVGSRIPSDPSEIPLKVAARTAPGLAFHDLVGALLKKTSPAAGE